MSAPSELGLSGPSTLHLPRSSNTCEIWAINTTTNIICGSAGFVQPEIKGHEIINLPTFAFYIVNRRLNQRVLFDCGSRKDWWNLPPRVAHAVKTVGTLGLDVKEDIYDILQAGGVDPKSTDAVVWSHHHYDHIGNIQRFPSSTALVVGPGFKKLFLPGYPAQENSPIFQADVEGRTVQEVNFDANSPHIGPFRAYDYFEDGSFYLLHTPGHTPGHLSAMVRTTPETFMFLGGDICHFPGVFRPTEHAPMASSIPLGTRLDSRFKLPCPCSQFLACHPKREDTELAMKNPYYDISQNPDSWNMDPKEAQKTVNGLKVLDAHPGVFVAIAHDPALLEVGLFPESHLNDWKARGFKTAFQWHFLTELPIDGKPGKPPIVQGFSGPSDYA